MNTFTMHAARGRAHRSARPHEALASRDASWRSRTHFEWAVWVVLALLSTIGSGCAAAPRVVSTVLDPDVDFATLRSFYVVQATEDSVAGHAAVAEAIARELTRRGETPAPRDEADMWLIHRARALDLQRQRVSSDPDANAPQVVGYVEGTLAIDVHARVGGRHIWHGEAVFDANTRADLAHEVDKAVRAILAELPGG